MDFRLKVFHSVATNLSFTKASKELFISQPAISKHIHELEVQYKTPLFDRVGSRIGLTHAGELLLSHTKQLLAAYRQMDFEMNLLNLNTGNSFDFKIILQGNCGWGQVRRYPNMYCRLFSPLLLRSFRR